MYQEKDGADVFVSNLTRIMREKDIKQVDIVRGMKLSTATVSQWVSGKIYPRIGMLQRLADFLGVTVSDLTSEKPMTYTDPAVAEMARLLKNANEDDKKFILLTIKRLLRGQ